MRSSRAQPDIKRKLGKFLTVVPDLPHCGVYSGLVPIRRFGLGLGYGDGDPGNSDNLHGVTDSYRRSLFVLASWTSWFSLLYLGNTHNGHTNETLNTGKE